MILNDDLTARRHMLQNIGHEEPSSQPESYQHVEHRAKQPRKRRALVGSGSGPEPKGRHNGRLVGSRCLTLALRRYGPMYACGHIDSFYDAQVRSLHSWCGDLCDVRVQLDSCVPVETALAPIGLTEFVCDFDRFDPFGVLVAELGRGAQP